MRVSAEPVRSQNYDDTFSLHNPEDFNYASPSRPSSPRPRHTATKKTLLDRTRNANLDIKGLDEKSSFASYEWYRNKTEKLEGDKAFGTLTFAGITQHVAKYALIKPRYQTNFDMKTIYEDLMIKNWEVPRPNLLISVTGIAQDIHGIDGGLMDYFRRGLYESANSTNAWIVSGGMNVGVMKEVGKARRQYSSAYGDEVPIVGLPMWNEIEEREQLTLAPDAIEQTHAHISANRTHRTDQTDWVHPLDPNHKYFLMIDDQDDGGKTLDGWKGYQFRRDFQNYIAANGGSRNDDGADDDDARRVQTVGVIFNGRLGSLLAVKEMLIERIPIVVIADSGGVADFIRYGIELLKDEGARDERIINSDIEHARVLSAMAKVDTQKVQEWLHNISLKTKNSEETRIWKENLQLILCQQDLINLYYHNGKESLEKSILSALMNNLTRNDLVDQLHLAMKLNQVDLARERINSAQTSISTESAHELMTEALLQNRVGFVQLLLDHSYVNISRYMTPDILRILYERGLEQERWQPGDNSFFQQIIRKKIPTNIDIIESINSKNVDGSLKLFDYIQYCEKKLFMSNWDSIYTRKKHIYSSTNSHVSVPYPLRDLFLWCLLFRRTEMAKMLWQTSDEGISFALSGALLCSRAGRLDQRDTDVLELYLEESTVYEKYAAEIYQIAYSKDPEKSYKLLTRVSDSWGKRTCLELAVEGQCREFMSLVGVQEQLSMIWRGNISLKQTYSQFFVVLAIAPIFWCLPSQKILFDETIPHYRRKQKLKEMGEMVHTKWYKKFMWFYQAPVSVFWLNLLFYLLFLGLFSYVIIGGFCYKPLWGEYLVIGWVLSLVAEETRQVFHEAGHFREKISAWIHPLSNKMDAGGFTLFIVGVVLRFMFYATYDGNLPNRCPLNFNRPEDKIIKIAHIFYCLSFIVLMMRTLVFYSVSRRLGPKVLMFAQMFFDMGQFLMLLIIFLAAYGIATQAILYPNEWRIKEVIENVIYVPYYHIYGDLFIAERNQWPFEDQLEAPDGCSDAYLQSDVNETYWSGRDDPVRCPNKNMVVSILQGIYMLFANVLLLNLLIAMFSTTFAKIETESEKYWKFERYFLIREYYYRPPLVPPFIIFAHIFNLFNYGIKICCRKKSVSHNNFDALSELKERRRSGKRPFRTFHRSAKMSQQDHACYTRNSFGEFDEMDNDTLTIFESWATETFVRNENEGRYMNTQELIYNRIEKAGDQMEDQINGHHATMEVLKKIFKAQETLLQEQNEDTSPNRIGSSSAFEFEWSKWVKSRSRLYNDSSIRRFVVPPDRYDWNTQFKDYKPVNYTSSRITGKKDQAPPVFADPMDPNEIPLNQWDDGKGQNRMSYEGAFEIENGYPKNPLGRTGITGRGVLAQWGPTHAVDPIITRVKHIGKDKHMVLEWIAVQRADSGEWSIPGGVIRNNEAECVGGVVRIKNQCFIRIITSKIFDETESGKHQQVLEKFKKFFEYEKEDIIYQGAADDARNTDNAWIETTAIDFHDSTGILADLDVITGSACWAELRDQDLFGSHRHFLKKIAERHKVPF